MNEFDLPVGERPVSDTSDVVSVNEVANETAAETQPEPVAAPEVVPAAPAVDPVRAAAGRLGARRLQQLAELGRQYEQEHGLTAGRQRLRQLVQLGKRFELEHGLRVAKPRRRKKGDAWAEFLAALARVVKPAYRPAVEKLAASLRAGGGLAAA